MKNWTLDELRDLAPAYVMETLSAEERAAFESALASSAELKADVADYRAVVERLGTEQSLAPSPDVRARFLERIALEKTVAFDRSTAAPVATSASSSSPTQTQTQAQAQMQAQSQSQLRTPRATGMWWSTGILGTALAASLVFAVSRNTELNATREDMATLTALIKADSAKLTRRDEELETVLEAEKDLKVVHLATQTPGGAGIQFFWNLKQGRGLLHAFRLPPASRGHAYQMWYIRDGKPVSVKVFNSDPDGHGLAYGFDVPKDLTGITLMAVTLEPEGGSTMPTSVPFMTGTMATQ